MRALLVSCVLAIVAALSTAPLSAQTVGIDFKSMPIGTKAHYVDERGRKFQYRYTGSYGSGSHKRYVLQVEGQYSHRRIYNTAGLLVALQGGSVKYTYSPFLCYRQLGDCSFFYDYEFSRFSGGWITKTGKTSNGYRVQMVSKNKNRDHKETLFYKLGKYNFFSEFVAGDTWYRLIKITTP